MCMLMYYPLASVCADSGTCVCWCVTPPACVCAKVLYFGTCVCWCVTLRHMCMLMCYPPARVCADVLPPACVCVCVCAYVTLWHVCVLMCYTLTHVYADVLHSGMCACRCIIHMTLLSWPFVSQIMCSWWISCCLSHGAVIGWLTVPHSGYIISVWSKCIIRYEPHVMYNIQCVFTLSYLI